MSFINQQLNEFKIKFPPNMVGKWQLLVQNKFKGKNSKPAIQYCHKFTFDVVET